MQADISKIAARVKLCSLNTGAWRATRLHRDETAKVNAAHHTTDAAKVHVRLTDSAALHGINKLHAAAYDAHRKLTLPTIQDGLRLIPAGREFQHSETMREFAEEHARLKVQFLAEYADEKRTAPIRLNGLYDARHWPDVSTIADKFTFSTRYLACPSDGSWAEWISESARAADEELRERLTEALQRVKDRCAAVDGKLYQTVFSNLRELIDLVPDMNFSDVPVYAQAITMAKDLATLDADTIRDSKTARKDAAQRANSILATLGAQ